MSEPNNLDAQAIYQSVRITEKLIDRNKAHIAGDVEKASLFDNAIALSLLGIDDTAQTRAALFTDLPKLVRDHLPTGNPKDNEPLATALTNKFLINEALAYLQQALPAESTNAPLPDFTSGFRPKADTVAKTPYQQAAGAILPVAAAGNALLATAPE